MGKINKLKDELKGTNILIYKYQKNFIEQKSRQFNLSEFVRQKLDSWIRLCEEKNGKA